MWRLLAGADINENGCHLAVCGYVETQKTASLSGNRAVRGGCVRELDAGTALRGLRRISLSSRRRPRFPCP